MASGEQLSNAEIIVNTGTQLGANAKQLLAAIEAALVESNLVNVRFGDRDSLGLFQQRPSQGWGTPQQILDPYYAASAFFNGAGSNKGVFAVSQTGTAGQLAQRVQRSAFPSRYDGRELEAQNILAQLGVYDSSSSANDEVIYADQTSYGDWPIEDLSQQGMFGGSIGIIAVGLVGLLVVTRLLNR